MASAIVDSYLRGEARAFFELHPSSPDDRRRAVERALRPLERSVADELEAQNAALAPSPARDAHLALLRRGAAAVVTGQQVGLFLGPLFTIYKAASAVRVAKALAAETGRPVVPVFWLQTEDHDLPEIAHTFVPRPGLDALELKLPSFPGERISIAHRTLSSDVAALLDELRAELGRHPHADEHLARLARHYRPGAGWSDAFAGVLAELFADEGLVFVNPRTAALGRVATPIHRRAMSDAGRLAGLLGEHVAKLEAAGFGAAVHVRRDSPLSFFHPEGPAGPRYRLEAVDHGFSELGGTRTHSRDALLGALEADPLRFSTSALLRPILQDTLLPTAAYVGGPGEVAYFAQLAPLYAAYGLPMPLIVPRARFRLVGERTRRVLERLELEPKDAERSEDELLARLRGADSEAAQEISRRLLDPFERALEDVLASAGDVSGALDRPVARTRATVGRAVSKFAAKVEQARLRRDRALVDDVRRVKAMLHPAGAPQERHFGLAYFAARSGDRALLEAVLEAVDPFDPTPKDLYR